MSNVYFSRIKLGLALLGSAGLFWVFLFVAMRGGAKAAVGGGVVALVMAFAMLYFARYLLDNRILSVGSSELEFHGLVSTRRLKLDHIALMRIETQTINYVKTRYLVIEPHQGYGWTIKIASTLLEGRFGGCEGVADLITNGAAEPGPFPLPRRAPTPPAGAAPAGWHERGAQPPAPPAAGLARAGGFGRKGL